MEADQVSYTEEQSSDVLEACARASWEAELAVDFAQGHFLHPWEKLDEDHKGKLKLRAALALDILVVADHEGGDVVAADRAVEEYMKQIGVDEVRATLVMSVIAAVKATLDAEIEHG